MIAQVIDFFCGAGGTSAGLRLAGLDIAVGIDNDRESGTTFQRNFPEARFLLEDIRSLRLAALRIPRRRRNIPLVFAASAPCQPFSKQSRDRTASDERIPLLWEVRRFVGWHRPEVLFMENVPGLASLADQIGPFTQFVEALKEEGYWVAWKEVNSQMYGVPQRRRRLVLLASRLGELHIPSPTHGPGTGNPYVTVWDAIGNLPPISAGQCHSDVPNHRSANLCDLNLERIRATPPGGGMESWPSRLLPRCHSNGYHGHSDVYGRLRKDAVAPGLTTRCISYSNGRFGHPEQDRGLSIREAACLQTFPADFVFSGSLNGMARQVGNAVPVVLARVFGEAIVAHLTQKHSVQLQEGAG